MRLFLPCLLSGTRKLHMSDNCIVRGLLAFCCLKQDLQDSQDFQDAGALCNQLRFVRPLMSIVIAPHLCRSRSPDLDLFAIRRSQTTVYSTPAREEP